jgi:hypothetical protein
MDPNFLFGLARMDLPLLTRVARDICPNLLGNLQYATVCTCRDVSKILSILGCAQAKPNEVHLQALKNVVYYLKGTFILRLSWRRGAADHNL